MTTGPAILIRVDKDTKDRMRKLKINWSGEIRNFIADRISRNGNKAHAMILTDKIFNSQKKKNTDSAETVRRFRDERYGAARSNS